jgi:hypothetical protein
MRWMMAALVTGSVLVMAVLGACGGDDGGSFDGTTVRSADGVLTVEVPEGAASDGVEVTIRELSEEDLPSELRGADPDAVAIVGYELGPDGAEFSEPVVVTFRIDPSEHGIELPDGAVPLGLLLTENSAGELESIEGAEVSREDGSVVVRAGMTHFSPAVLMLSQSYAYVLTPAKLELEEGGQAKKARVVVRQGSSDSPVNRGAQGRSDLEWSTTPPFEAVSDHDEAAISCDVPTEGWVSGAYRVEVARVLLMNRADFDLQHLLGGLNLFDQNLDLASSSVSGDAKCNGSGETATPEVEPSMGTGSASTAAASPTSPVATVGPRSASNSGYDISVSGSSGDTPVDENDCYGQDAPLDTCPDEVDIVHMAWGMRADQPDLLEVTVTFAGPFAGPDTTIMSVTVWGDDTNNFTVQAILENGEVSCKYPGQPDSPLPGESCGVNASGQVEVALDVSGTAGGFRVSARSFQLDGDDRKEDKVYLVGITRP